MRAARIAFAALLLASASAGAAPQPRGRAVVLESRANALYDTAIAGFKSRYAGEVRVLDIDGSADRWDDLRADAEAERPTVVVAVGLKAAAAVRAQRPRAPVVYCMVMEPERHGLGSIPGVPLDVGPVAQLEGIRRALPSLTKLGVVYDPNRSEAFLREANAAAPSLGIEIVARATAGAGGVPAAYRSLPEDVGALWIIPDASVAEADAFRFLLGASLKKKVPVIAYSDGFVRAGALAAVAPDYFAMGAEAARIASALESGGADTAARVPKPRLIVKRKTAELLGLAGAIEARADEVLP